MIESVRDARFVRAPSNEHVHRAIMSSENPLPNDDDVVVENPDYKDDGDADGDADGDDEVDDFDEDPLDENEECFRPYVDLARSVRDLHVPKQCARLDAPPTSLQFLRDYVSANVPVVMRGCFDHWPALQKWNDAFLTEVVGDTAVSVEVTPGVCVL